jgi:Putative zinc-finger
MKELSETNHCERALDLIAYLYGEASEAEAKSFEGHMAHCGPCAAELEAFGHVRASVGAWRAEALGSLTSPALATAFAPAAPSALAPVERKPSALAALREFFALSPLWLRGATGFAALTVCALVVFAAVKLLEEPRVVVVEKVVKQGPTQAEVDAMVKTRVQEQLAAQGQREELASVQPQTAAAPAPARKPALVTASMTGTSGASLRRGSVQRRSRTSVSPQESEQLARDLQLIPTRDEDDLPRLIDLMDEAN